MLGLIQRVSSASVTVDNEIAGQINCGLLLLLGMQRDDDEHSLERLLHKVLHYRVFPDNQGRMNHSLIQTNGELLIVSQFTLAADTHKGLRPGFSTAAAPEIAERLYNEFITRSRPHLSKVASGRFGADMQVSLTNDGPVTFLLTS